MIIPSDLKKWLKMRIPGCIYSSAILLYIEALEEDIGSKIGEIVKLESAQPKWISVKDNPPDGTKEVIACNMYGEMLIGHVLAMSNGKDYYCETLQDNIYNVTHWMPRPKLPKEE